MSRLSRFLWTVPVSVICDGDTTTVFRLCFPPASKKTIIWRTRLWKQRKFCLARRRGPELIAQPQPYPLPRHHPTGCIRLPCGELDQWERHGRVPSTRIGTRTRARTGSMTRGSRTRRSARVPFPYQQSKDKKDWNELWDLQEIHRSHAHAATNERCGGSGLEVAPLTAKSCVGNQAEHQTVHGPKLESHKLPNPISARIWICLNKCISYLLKIFRGPLWHGSNLRGIQKDFFFFSSSFFFFALHAFFPSSFS